MSDTKKKILIVEDEEDVSRVLVKRLSTAGYDVLAVSDATSATKELHGYKPDLVLLDLMLPGGGGITVLDRLKLSNHTRHIPVVVLSGAGDDFKKKAEAKQISGFIAKPYDAQDLLNKIQSVLAGE